MWYVYIVRCKDGKLYTGITNDLDRRLKEHNSGNGGRFTKYRNPVSLVHKESAEDKRSALKREAEIKGMTREKKEGLIRSFGPSHSVGSSGRSLA